MSDFKAKVKRVAALRVIDHREPVWMPVSGVPASRQGCPDTSKELCRHVQCWWHLGRVEPSDKAGRPSLGKVRRDSRGYTESQPGDLGDDRGGTDLRPFWLDEHGELTHVPTCGRDEIERAGRPLTNEELGVRIGKHRTLAARIVDRALKKLRDAGVSIDELRLLADPEAAIENMRDGSKPTGRKP